MTKEESSQTKRRLSILKKSNNGKQEKRRRVSFGTSNQLITYSNNDKKINETSSLSFKREYVPLNDELTEKENFENENFEQSVSTSISKETEIDDKSLKSTPTSFLNRFFANYEDNISEDDNSTLEITGTNVQQNDESTGRSSITGQIDLKSIRLGKNTPKKRKESLNFSTPESANLQNLKISTEKIAELLKSSEKSENENLSKNDISEINGEIVTGNSIYNFEKSVDFDENFTEEQTTYYKTLTEFKSQNKQNDKTKNLQKDLKSPNKKTENPQKNIEKQQRKTNSEYYSKFLAKNMQNLAFPMKQDFAKPKSFSEKLKFFILQKPLSLKLSTELQKLETEIYETEKSVEKLENEINDFGKNENNFKQFVEKIEDVSVAEILIRKTAKIEEQKTESEKINRKNKISSICTFVLSKQCSELEEILLSLNNKNAFLYSNRLSIDKSLQSLEERHFRDLKRKIEENDERMAKLKEKQKKVNEFEEKKEKEKMRAENELRFGKVYQILSSALGAVPLNLDENGFRFKTGQNRFFVEVLENGKIFVSLLNENEKIISIVKMDKNGKIEIEKNKIEETVHENQKISKIAKKMNLGNFDLLSEKIFHSVQWQNVLNTNERRSTKMLKLNLIAESITSTISKLSAMFLKSAQTKSPIIIFVNKSVLLPTPKTIENGQNAFCHFWLINNKRKHCHFWLNFTNILQCLVEEKRFENDFETGKICVLKDINSKIKEKEVLVKIKENLVKLFEGNGVKRMEEIVEKIVLGICEEVGVKFDGV